MRLLVPALTAALSFSCFSTALAQTPWTADDGARKAIVRYDDLDLSSPSGVAALKQRVAAAARTVCGPEPSLRELKNSDDFRACVTQASDAAGSASVAAIVSARAGPRAVLAAASAETK